MLLGEALEGGPPNRALDNAKLLSLEPADPTAQLKLGCASQRWAVTTRKLAAPGRDDASRPEQRAGRARCGCSRRKPVAMKHGGLVWTLIRTDFKYRYHGTMGSSYGRCSSR
jgi:hypothetical protein